MAEQKRRNMNPKHKRVATAKAMKHYIYTVTIHKADPDEIGYWAEVPSLPGCVSEGDTYEQTLANIQEAMQLYLDGLVQEGLPIPKERAAQAPKQVVMHVDVPAAV